MRTHPSVWILPFVVGATLGGVHAAYARDCSADSDCPRGYTCSGTTTSVDGGETGTCLASACQTDSDCGTGFRCEVDAYTECVGNACAPASICQPQYDVPCETDGDCGPGFACSGSVGGYNCGAHQDAGFPYGTTMTVPCEDVPKPPFLPPPDSGFNIPAICQPGSTCTSNTYKTCQSQAPGSCQIDSDCPSTWTCACEEAGGLGGGLVLADASATTSTSCTKACVAPNSDLGAFGGNGTAGGASFGPAGIGGGLDAGTTETAGMAPLDAGAANADVAGSHASDSQGGCDIGGGSGGADWFWATIGALVAAFPRRWRKAAARRPPAAVPLQTP
jgi:hypothetical protein